MNQTALESRPLYSIGTVSRLTGIKADTLRAWERRYGLGASRKSSGGHREYTQSDMEHLQIVAALVANGMRIGDIANRDKRTLGVLVQSTEKAGGFAPPKVKLKVLFIGEDLSEWLDDHQGSISQVSALIARCSLESFMATEEVPEHTFDAVFVECKAMDNGVMQQLQDLRSWSKTARLTACFGKGNGPWAKELARIEIAILSHPPEAAELAFEINSCMVDKTRYSGDYNKGGLLTTKARHYSDEQLTATGSMTSEAECNCPTHISALVQQLNSFEHYCAGCAAKDWPEAAIHSCVYAYTNQARWLMEKALQAVLEEGNENGSSR